MLNADKIRNVLGEQLFQFIAAADKEQLEKMLNEITTDIKICEVQYPELVRIRQIEKSLIEYRLY